MGKHSKLLVIIASADKQKALTALMYAKNTIHYKWLDDVKVLFFGPSENLMINDPDVRHEAESLAEVTEPIACKFLADRDGLTEEINSIGMEVNYVGTVIAELLKEGYVPMVW
jgi:hypothetical protein